MKNLYVNRIELDDIDPARLAEFADSHGWTEFPVKRKGMKIFQRWAGDDYFQITIPFDKTFTDYESELLRACDGLAESVGVQFERKIFDFSFLEK